MRSFSISNLTNSGSPTPEPALLALRTYRLGQAHGRNSPSPGPLQNRSGRLCIGSDGEEHQLNTIGHLWTYKSGTMKVQFDEHSVWLGKENLLQVCRRNFVQPVVKNPGPERGTIFGSSSSVSAHSK